MAGAIPIREADLRAAMRDDRYWRFGHPERAAFVDWVTSGWHSLYPSDGSKPPGGVVWVRPYDRQRNGRAEHVEGYWRQAASSVPDQHKSDIHPVAAPPRNPNDPRGRPLPLEGDGGMGTGGGGGGRGRAPQQANPTPPRSASPPRTIEEMREAAALENITGRNTRISRLAGNANARDEQFGRLHDAYGRPALHERMTEAGAVRFFDLRDGRRILSRPSTDGRPTIEIAKPTTRGFRTTDEFRFGHRSGETAP